ncbi:hypothetical protein PIB30_102452 [Stylosanthes scabra]|uniref:Uncharacterized protein n=1 Tax=Stylosanthes scabra TaxID=79078 RepID=A0ABU6TXE1_9FABA|nr:hypothetical protein [Stylosanthes scabra]
MEETRTNLKNQGAAIKNLEVQVGEIAKQLAHKTPNTFPNDTIPNPKVKCKAISVMMVKETSIKDEKVEAEVSPPPISPRPQSMPPDKGSKKKSKEDKGKSVDPGESPHIPTPSYSPHPSALVGNASKTSSKDTSNHFFDPP